MEPLSLLPKLLSPIKDAFLFFQRKWWPPKFGYKLAHSNILEIIGPYVPKEKVIEILGHPHRIENGSAGYRFANALLQINYKDDWIESVAIVSLKMRWPNRFTVFPFDFKIGTTTFEEIREHTEVRKSPMEMEVDCSSKFYCLSYENYFGHPGRYFYYNFALFSGATYPLVDMPAANYDSREENNLYGPTDLLDTSAKFNGVCISTNEQEGFRFSFQLFN